MQARCAQPRDRNNQAEFQMPIPWAQPRCQPERQCLMLPLLQALLHLQKQKDRSRPRVENHDAAPWRNQSNAGFALSMTSRELLQESNVVLIEQSDIVDVVHQ